MIDSETNKDSKNENQNLNEFRDRIDCLQRSQVYVHNHVTKVEESVEELKGLILQRLTDIESFGVQMTDVN
jgi:hypothetical protein